MACEELFLKQLRERGFRLTPQREMVLLVLHQIGHPAAAEEIHARVAEKSGSVELSTIYRTLDLLISMNIVSLIDTGDKQRLYELAINSTPHLHLVCRNCGKITAVELGVFQPVLQPLLDTLREQAHFSTDLNNLTIPGLCLECAPAPTTPAA